MNFFKQLLINPIETGAIAPSSRELSQLITYTAHLSKKKCVVELGSGTGVFTKEIITKISSECIFFCLEINQQFVKETKKNCPSAIVYHASAKDIKKYLLKHKQNTCDCIISSLPWANFDQKMQEELLNAAYDSLEEGGEFLTFANIHGLFLPTGIRIRKSLEKKFTHVEKTKMIWKNLPPACVFRCRK